MVGNIYSSAEEVDRAVETLRRARRMTEAAYPPGHPAIANVLITLASAEQCGMRSAGPETALATIRGVSGVGAPDDPETAILLAVHAGILRRLGDGPVAERLLLQAAEIDERTYGPEHPVTQESKRLLRSPAAPG
jgi:hypothetical protein